MNTLTLIGFVGSAIGIIGSFVTIGIAWGTLTQKLEQVPKTIEGLQSAMSEKINKLAKDTDERLDGHDVSIKDLYDSRLEQANAVTRLSENMSFVKEQLSDLKSNINQTNIKLDYIMQELSKKGV